MDTKGRQRLALMAKMKRLQQKRKGKQKVLLEGQEEDESFEDDVPIVTFIEKFEESISEECNEVGMSTTIAQTRPNLEQVQFHLDEGRVDVGEVFEHLDTSMLQFEFKPGIWRDLRSLRTGKSSNKFKNKQEVNIRRTGLSNWWPSSRPGLYTYLELNDHLHSSLSHLLVFQKLIPEKAYIAITKHIPNRC